MPIKNISDANMIRIMANENIEEWKTSPSVIHETIKVAKTFLNSELAKYKPWDECQRLNKFISSL